MESSRFFLNSRKKKGLNFTIVDCNLDTANIGLRGFREHLTQSGITIFRDQSLTLERLVEVSSVLGSKVLLDPSLVRIQEFPELLVLSNDVNLGFKDSGCYWHQDGTYYETPVRFSIFYCLKTFSGHKTLFQNSLDAYSKMKKSLQDKLHQCAFIHGTPDNRVRAIHPAVMVHPETGRRGLRLHYLLGRERTDQKDSSELLSEVERFLNQQKSVYTHQWRAGDLLIVDQFSTLHRGVANKSDQLKLMLRACVRQNVDSRMRAK